MSDPVAGIRELLGKTGVVIVPPSGPVVIYLHANQGKPLQEDVIHLVSALDGVERVEVSSHAWTILLVWLTADSTGPSTAGR